MKNEDGVKVAVESLAGLLKKFNEYYGKSIAELMKAAKVYADARRIFGKEAEAAFSRAFPQFGRKDWQMLVKIAGRELSPKVFMMTSNYMISKVGTLPYETQVDVLGDVGEEPKALPVLSRGSVVHKPMTMMNASEISSVIDTNAGRVRTVDEQIKAAAAALSKKKAEPKWEVCNDVLAVHRQCVICGDDLETLYAEIGKVVGKRKRGVA